MQSRSVRMSRWVVGLYAAGAIGIAAPAFAEPSGKAPDQGATMPAHKNKKADKMHHKKAAPHDKDAAKSKPGEK